MHISLNQRFIGVLLGIVLSVAFLVSCSPGTGESQDKKHWTIGTPVPERNIMATFIHQTMEGTESATDGKFKMSYYQNFDEQVLSEYLVRGRIEMLYLSATGIAVLVPEASILNLPYLWDSDPERDLITDHCVLPKLNESFKRRGLEIVRIGEAGWSNLFCKSAACVDPDALVGARVRVAPNKASRLFYRKLETNGISLPLPDTWPALQLGVVDISDLTFSYYLVTPAAQIAPFYFFTRHIHQPAFFVANSEAWAGLSDEERAIVLSSMPTTLEMRSVMNSNEEARIREFRERGGEVFMLSAEQNQKYKSKVAPYVPDLAQSYGPEAVEIYEIIMQAKERFAAMGPDESEQNPEALCRIGEG